MYIEHSWDDVHRICEHEVAEMTLDKWRCWQHETLAKENSKKHDRKVWECYRHQHVITQCNHVLRNQ